MATTFAKAQNTILLTANGKTVNIVLEQNDATTRLVSLLEQGALTLNMTDNDFEKIGTLPESLPTNDVRQTAQAGDIMLYVGNVLCIFYDTNTWAYTRIGRIEGMSSSDLKSFLNGNHIEVTLSLNNNAGISESMNDVTQPDLVFDINGIPVKQRPLPKGLYVIDGKKTLVK